MYLFSFPISFPPSNTHQELLIPCYFCQARAYKIPLHFRPEPLFTPNQLVTHFRLETIHLSQHIQQPTGSISLTFNNTQPIGTQIRTTNYTLFPLLAHNWRAFIQFITHYLPDPLLIVNANTLPCNRPHRNNRP